MKRKTIITPLGCLLAVVMAIAASAADNDYNVLLISVDDLNTDIACYGADHVKTPNMDRIAKMGVRFDKAYCQVAVCGASRQSMLFGLRPNTTGVHQLVGSARTKNPSAVSLPQLFRKNGIYTARVGKIYHYMNPKDIGTDGHDDEQSWDERFNPSGIDVARTAEILVSQKGRWIKARHRNLGLSHAWWDPVTMDEEHTDGMVATKVIDLIEEHKEERFFIAAGFYKPHCPYVAPKHYFDLYPLDKVVVPNLEEEMADREDVPPEALGGKYASISDVPIEHVRRLRQAYYATTTFLDAQIGRVLDALEKNKLLDKTIILFWSDHGYFLGEKALWYKYNNFERSLRAPMMIAAPGIAQGTCPRVVEFLDVYPTIADLAGLKPQSTLEGISLKPLLKDPSAKWTRPAIGQDKKGYSIRTEAYRFVRWGNSKDKWELYDHSKDPQERTNLIHQNKYLDVADKMNKTLMTYMEAPEQ